MTIIKREINRLYSCLRRKRLNRAMNRMIEELRRLTLATRSAGIALNTFKSLMLVTNRKVLSNAKRQS